MKVSLYAFTYLHVLKEMDRVTVNACFVCNGRHSNCYGLSSGSSHLYQMRHPPVCHGRRTKNELLCLQVIRLLSVDDNTDEIKSYQRQPDSILCLYSLSIRKLKAGKSKTNSFNPSHSKLPGTLLLIRLRSLVLPLQVPAPSGLELVIDGPDAGIDVGTTDSLLDVDRRRHRAGGRHVALLRVLRE